jgi:hypothetical protein
MSNRAENYELYLAVDGGADEEEMDMKERPAAGTRDLGHWRYFAEISGFASLRPIGTPACYYRERTGRTFVGTRSGEAGA